MTKSFKRLAAEELLAFSKTGATITKECIETSVSEIGKTFGHRKKFQLPTQVALVEWGKSKRKG